MFVSKGNPNEISQGVDFEQSEGENVLSEFGINIRRLAFQSFIEVDGLIEKSDVIEGLIYQMIGRFQAMAESIVNGDPDPEIFDEQALGVAYALVPYVGLHAALGLKALAFEEAQRRYLAGDGV